MRRRWPKPSARFNVRKDNEPILGVQLRKPLYIDITYSQEYEIWRAVDDGNGLSLYDYWRGLYSNEFLARLLAYWRLKAAERAHTAEAQDRAAKLEAKRKR